jgi:Family of unknown function (DUF5989)
MDESVVISFEPPVNAMSKATEKKTEPTLAAPGQNPATKPADDFARQAEKAPPGLIAEFVDFLIHNKKWWLTPIIIVLVLLGIFAWLASTPAAPFIYNVF